MSCVNCDKTFDATRLLSVAVCEVFLLTSQIHKEREKCPGLELIRIFPSNLRGARLNFLLIPYNFCQEYLLRSWKKKSRSTGSQNAAGGDTLIGRVKYNIQYVSKNCHLRKLLLFFYTYPFYLHTTYSTYK